MSVSILTCKKHCIRGIDKFAFFWMYTTSLLYAWEEFCILTKTPILPKRHKLVENIKWVTSMLVTDVGDQMLW